VLVTLPPLLLWAALALARSYPLLTLVVQLGAVPGWGAIAILAVELHRSRERAGS
jgi:hypothetical protein